MPPDPDGSHQISAAGGERSEPPAFILNRMQAKKNNNFKSGLHTIRVKTIPGSEFSSVN